jgi:hypothetical protein
MVAASSAIDRLSMEQGNNSEIAWRSATAIKISSLPLTIFLEGRKRWG